MLPIFYAHSIFHFLKFSLHIAYMSLYSATQRYLRFGFRFFYHKVHIQNIENFPKEGPVLIIPNHPNSFMDALVVGAYLPRPTSFLARGDAFKNPILAKLFKTYHMLPVYRASEGKENIEKNFETFDASYQEVNKGGSVLLFGEGLCINNWDLRSLKKGPARIAQRAWTSNDIAKDLVIVPVGLTYEHYDGGGKSLLIHYGKPITKMDMADAVDTPAFVHRLNERIAGDLESLAYINRTQKPNSKEHQQMAYTWKQAEQKGENVLEVLKQTQQQNSFSSVSGKRWFTPLHATLIVLPHYWLMNLVARKLTKGSVFYDSILFGFTLFFLPLYLITLLVVLYCIW